MHWAKKTEMFVLGRVSFLVAVAAAVGISYLKLKRRGKKLPPTAAGLIETVREMTSRRAPWFLLEKSRLHGSVFQVSLNRYLKWWQRTFLTGRFICFIEAQIFGLYVLTDPKMARFVLEGDKNTRGGEKTSIYPKFLFVTAGISN